MTDMVLRSSSLPLGSGGIGVGVSGFEVQRLSRSTTFSSGACGGRVSSLACAGLLRCASTGAASCGAVRMSATPDDGRIAPEVEYDDSSIKSVMVRIHGKVQGVFYRNWTVETAKQLGVNGWVRNNKDGSVEAVLSGKSSAVDTLLQKCEVGPPAAKVSTVEATPYKDTVAEGFERKPTIW